MENACGKVWKTQKKAFSSVFIDVENMLISNLLSYEAGCILNACGNRFGDQMKEKECGFETGLMKHEKASILSKRFDACGHYSEAFW